ncbi:MAG: hypothetical protein ACREXT_05930, partial [Gammaproteobacteria bacterium]
GELTTVAREDQRDIVRDIDTFAETGAFDEPKTLIPERASKIFSDSKPVDDFDPGDKTPSSDATTVLPNPASDDIFDVTGSSDEIPRQATVVLPKSPLRGLGKDSPPSPPKKKR